MNVSTLKISNLIHDSEVRFAALHSEVRSAALLWILSLLGTALLTFVIYLLGITPAWD
jgi:hypothetical protein